MTLHDCRRLSPTVAGRQLAAVLNDCRRLSPTVYYVHGATETVEQLPARCIEVRS